MRAEGKGELGLASLTASMMGQGSVRLTEAQLSDELQKLGSSVSVSSAQYNNLVTISSLTDKLPQTRRWYARCSSGPACAKPTSSGSRRRCCRA